MLSSANHCDNQNHKRRNAPVRFCPKCGGVVNDAVDTMTCSSHRHAELRRIQSLFCIDCGERLRADQR